MKNFNIKKSNGAVLIMSLSVLMILTMLTVSTMNAAFFEERMAASTQSKSITFQATESAINATTANKVALDNAIIAAIDVISSTDIYPKPRFGRNVDSSVAITRTSICQKQLVQGFSFRFGAICNIELDSLSIINGTGAKTNNIQGLAYIVPKTQQHQ